MSLDNRIRREAERVLSQKAPPLMGIVSGYDPSKYAAKVILQPDGVETGFIQIGSPWVGDGWGMSAGPCIGDIVDVHFQEWGKGAPYIKSRFYGNKARPPGAPSGEFWLVHKTGSSFKLTNDGRVTIADKAGSKFILNGDGTTLLNSNLIVNGSINATGDIIDNTGTNANTMASFRHLYDAHRHTDSMSGTTSPPLAPNVL